MVEEAESSPSCELCSLDDSDGPALPITSEQARALVSNAVERAFEARLPRSRRVPVQWAFAALIIALAGAAAGLVGPRALLSTASRWVEPAASTPPAVGARPPLRRAARVRNSATEPEQGTEPVQGTEPLLPNDGSAATEPPLRVGGGPMKGERSAPAAPVRAAVGAADPKAASGPSEAEDLLQSANQLRRSGDWRRAERTYSEVLRTHPSTAQSYVAALAAAELRLEHLGDPRGALQLYQSVGASGSLAAEALFGAARCQRALGDARAEADTLRKLVLSRPGKLLLTQAEKRLRQLDGSTP